MGRFYSVVFIHRDGFRSHHHTPTGWPVVFANREAAERRAEESRRLSGPRVVVEELPEGFRPTMHDMVVTAAARNGPPPSRPRAGWGWCCHGSLFFPSWQAHAEMVVSPSETIPVRELVKAAKSVLQMESVGNIAGTQWDVAMGRLSAAVESLRGEGR